MPVPKVSDVQSDVELIRLAALRDETAIRQIIRTYNRRLYRLARAIMGNDADAEDVVQEAYIRAFNKLSSFRHEASLSTWLSRITINEALMRQRSKHRQKRSAPPNLPRHEAQIINFPLDRTDEDPERIMAQRQILQIVEEATDALPEIYRLVFVARVIEGLSLEETAALLELETATVKTRLFRARKLIKDQLEAQIGPVLLNAFPFAGKRCATMAESVIDRLRAQR
ncbi:RNA polymerase sigma factor [Ochrobactrum teleogrylli]|uniref:RNA polymerase sigma factor n=1 Tax=Ochrobactrum teleogrylli TaxID=2479765 RepID=UPI00384D38A0